jgi:hypothetical protein
MWRQRVVVGRDVHIDRPGGLMNAPENLANRDNPIAVSRGPAPVRYVGRQLGVPGPRSQPDTARVGGRFKVSKLKVSFSQGPEPGSVLGPVDTVASRCGTVGCRTLHARGDLDRAGAGLLVGLVEHELTAGYRQVRVDLAGLNSITTAGLDTLNAARQELNAQDDRFLLNAGDDSGLIGDRARRTQDSNVRGGPGKCTKA